MKFTDFKDLSNMIVSTIQVPAKVESFAMKHKS